MNTISPTAAMRHLSQPLAMRQGSIEAFAAACRGVRADMLDDLLGLVPQPLSLEVSSDGIATIPVRGVVGKGLAEWEKQLLGMTDVDEVQDLIAAAGNDAGVRGVVLDVASPGGVVTGVPELATAVADLRRRKPVLAWTEDMACSAAYWIASQATGVYATPSACVGSVGVYCVLYDTSEAYAGMGVRPVLVKAGQHKAIGVSGLPISEEDAALVGEGVQHIYGLFTDAVRSTRPVSDGTMQGQDYFGIPAKAAGLVDEVVQTRTAMERDIRLMAGA